MRPVRIEMQGFAAFRERAVVDLVETDLFALVGPTGAGKSTVIDAMVFALYGSVPRYGSKGLVYPVITQGALEARVRLDFVVGDDTYTATRVVRRTRSGASTKEARLERWVPGDAPGDDTVVLAEDADGLTVSVCELVGLDLEQFTKCVVLPQGAFATLLHDTKATRQDLLVKLLDLGLYERLAAAARAEAKRSAQRIEFLDEQLGRSAHATPEAVAAEASRVAALEGLLAELDDAAPALSAVDERIAAADRGVAETRKAIGTLAGLEAPDDVSEISRAASEAAAAVESAETAERESADAVTATEAEAAALPDAAMLRTVVSDRDELAGVEARIAKGAALLAEVEATIVEARAAVAVEAEVHAAAEADRERARVADAAADLARHLHEGDDCPVCGSEIAQLPTVDAQALRVADAHVESAAKTLRIASEHLDAQEKTAASYRAKLEDRTVDRDRITARLAEAPSAEEVTASLTAIAAAEEAVRRARSADDAARAETKRRRSLAERAAADVAAARSSFVAARDRVAAFGPPSATDDLEADWKELVQWVDGERVRHHERSENATAERAAAVAERDEGHRVLGERAAAVGVEPEPAGTLRDRAIATHAATTARHDQLRSEQAAAGDLRDERTRLDEHRQVHELLAEQLGARGFEAWLLDEALDALLDGASTWLEQLSSGRYAMAVDDKKQFAVIDHANADERRIARTLSGGETFLASLALALALAERVSELSATGGARRGSTLDAIFLDEGFGTLDPETLDVVATAIEELGATGRMVGIISHVADLAERVPVRFEVTKTPGTSTIARVDA